jgi:small-conductance mechanosensitive channel
VDLGVAYDSDERLVQRLLLDIARRSPLVLQNPPPELWFMKFGDNSLDFSLVCWFANPAIRWQFMTQVRFEILQIFREHGIKIPFPQRTLSLLDDKAIPLQLVRRLEPAGQATGAGTDGPTDGHRPTG